MRYRFHVHSAAFALMDVVGMELPDNDCAKAIARLIIESFEDDQTETHTTPWTRCVEIQDYKGTPLMAVPFKSLH